MNIDYPVTQLGKYLHIFIGSKEKGEIHQNSESKLCSFLISDGFGSRFSISIQSDAWKNFICGLNLITARYHYNSGELRKKCLKDLKIKYNEGYKVAKKLGISMPVDYVDKKNIFLQQ